MDMKKLSVIILLILSLVTFAACNSDDLTYAKRTVKNKYGVDLPKNTQLDFFYKEPIDFHGDTVMYFVFKFESTPTETINSFQSNNLKSDEQGEELVTELRIYFKSALDLLGDKVLDDYKPDWDVDFEWNYGENLNGMPALYYPDMLQMIICYYTM